MMDSLLLSWISFDKGMASVTSAVAIVGSSLVLLFFLSFFSSRGRYYKNAPLPPYMKENMYQTVCRFMDGTIPDVILKNMREIGPVFRLNLPEQAHFIVISDPSIARFILETEPEKPVTYSRFNKVSFGLDTMFSKRTHDNSWHFARKGAAPAFSMKNIKSTIPCLESKIETFCSVLNDYSDKQHSFDIADFAVYFTMEYLMESMFGLNIKCFGKDGKEGQDILKDLSVAVKEYALLQAFNPLRFLMFWDSHLQEAALATNRTHGLCQRILNEYRAKMSPDQIATDSSILGHLIRSPYASDKERCADMTMFLIAGHDTTGFTLAWALVEIARNPAVGAKIREELAAVAPASTTSKYLTLDQLSSLTYLEMVIKEVYRLWPVASLGSFRELSKDHTYNGMILPKGSYAILPYYAIFRSAGVSNPDEFNPDRWREGAPDADKLNLMLTPFALGKRNCIGQTLATLELKSGLAHLVRSFIFSVDDKYTINKTYFLTMKPVNAFLHVEKISQ